MRGIITKNTGSNFLVKDGGRKITLCKLRGNMRLKDIRSTSPVAVGDVVDFEVNADGIGVITDIGERRNFIVRRASNLSKQSSVLAANLDLTALVITVNFPETSTVFIDRFLAVAEAYNVPACLIFNKTDCYRKDEMQYLDAMQNLYETVGYRVFKISALDKATLAKLTDYLKNKTTLIAGNSGVGKSTLINQLSSSAGAKTGEISSYHLKGMHTTTFSEMFSLDAGGEIIDTPGIKGFGTFEMKREEIGHYFREIFRFSENCRFSNCTHTNEPHCAVIKALNDGYVSQSRYNSYISMIEEVGEGKYR